MVVDGLVAKPELNGRTGTVLGFDNEKGRYSVELDGTSGSFMIKSSNLRLHPGREQTKKQQEDADRGMTENRQKDTPHITPITDAYTPRGYVPEPSTRSPVLGASRNPDRDRGVHTELSEGYERKGGPGMGGEAPSAQKGDGSGMSQGTGAPGMGGGAPEKYEVDVSEKKERDPKYDATVDKKKSDDALAAEKKKNDDALAAAGRQLAVEVDAAKATLTTRNPSLEKEKAGGAGGGGAGGAGGAGGGAKVSFFDMGGDHRTANPANPVNTANPANIAKPGGGGDRLVHTESPPTTDSSVQLGSAAQHSRERATSPLARLRAPGSVARVQEWYNGSLYTGFVVALGSECCAVSPSDPRFNPDFVDEALAQILSLEEKCPVSVEQISSSIQGDLLSVTIVDASGPGAVSSKTLSQTLLMQARNPESLLRRRGLGIPLRNVPPTKKQQEDADRGMTENRQKDTPNTPITDAYTPGGYVPKPSTRSPVLGATRNPGSDGGVQSELSPLRHTFARSDGLGAPAEDLVGYRDLTLEMRERDQRAKQDGDGNRVRTRSVQERENLEQEERLRRAHLNII